MHRPFLLTGAALLIACAADDGTTPSPAVASIVVSFTPAAPIPGQTVQAAARLLDGAGVVLTGRTVAWQSQQPAVATITAAGVITTVTAGTTLITATSGGVSGSAVLTVGPAPVAFVEIVAPARVKVGDTYQLSARAHLADGTVVERPMTWSLANPTQGQLTDDGMLTPAVIRTIVVRAEAEGVIGFGSVEGYDWEVHTGREGPAIFLLADVEVIDADGFSEYPSLVLQCDIDGKFEVALEMTTIRAIDGAVSYGFDANAMISSTWLRGASGFSLKHPGPTTRDAWTLAGQLALARRFTFVFTEFSLLPLTVRFRVTGLGAFLTPTFAGCDTGT